MFLLLLYLLLNIALIYGHPDPNPWYNSKCESVENITFYSYHVHVLFWQQNNESVTNSFELYNKFINTFDVNTNFSECNDDNTTHNQSPSLCILFIDYPEPECPFLTSDWAVFLRNDPELFASIIPWFMKQRMEYEAMMDILVHPNSGCEIYDHRDWGFWIGKEWEIDLSCLHYDAPGYDEYDCKDKAQLLLFDNNGMNYNQYCDLQINNITQSFIQTNTDIAKIKFCSTLCQSWIDNILQFSIDCPSDCDYWINDINDEQLCKVYWNSFDDLYNWSLYQCGQ